MMNFPVGMQDDVLDAVAYQLQVTAQEESSQLSIHIPDYV
jgi:hypothetical protein